MVGLKDKLAALATMSLAQLRDEWRQIYEAAAPMVPASMLRLGIAYRMQEKGRGGAPAALSRELVSIQSRSQLPSRRPQTQAPSPGARLVRTWQGRTISVLVTDDGFLFNDKSYTSLTSIACEVTNSKRSGPRFFGLIDHA
jgi:hypothetical protein